MASATSWTLTAASIRYPNDENALPDVRLDTLDALRGTQTSLWIRSTPAHRPDLDAHCRFGHPLARPHATDQVAVVRSAGEAAVIHARLCRRGKFAPGADVEVEREQGPDAGVPHVRICGSRG